MPAPKPGSPAYEKRAKQRADAITWAENLYHYKLVGRAVGLDEDTLKKWRDKDPKFADELEQARTRFLNKHVRKARPEFLLERLEPDIFKERKDITSDDKPLAGATIVFEDVPAPKD
jgi:hypothetical protein